ncbi:MAG: glyoxalase superfamily protein [Bdellovibrionales bacterium]
MIISVNHVAICIPENSDTEARAFYGDVLGLQEIPKPDVLQKNGGIWFELTAGLQLHLTVQKGELGGNTKAHVAYEIHSLVEMKQVLQAANIFYTPGEKIPGYERINIKDPFGNRIEFMERSN